MKTTTNHIQMLLCCSVIYCVICVHSVLAVVDQDCYRPLGMQEKDIKDDQITVSSNPGRKGRLHKDRDAWCPLRNLTNTKGLLYDQYIQIDLLKITRVTRFATQGRYYSGSGQEKSETFKLSYSSDNKLWTFYHLPNGTDKIFEGNVNEPDLKTVKRNTLIPSVLARYIRLHPGYYYKVNPVCVRLELYGCPVEDNENAIQSYSAPLGDTVNNHKYRDNCTAGLCNDGVGLLTNNVYGPVNSKESGGDQWLGWLKDNSTKSRKITIIFEFYKVQIFESVIITMNINSKRNHQLFNSSRISFSNDLKSFPPDALDHCPTPLTGFKNVNITINLCGNVGKVIKFDLVQVTKWMLITEIKFNSAPSQQNYVDFKKCWLSTCSSPATKPPVVKTETTASSVPPQVYTSSSNNTRTIIVLVCVVLLVLIILVVLFFFLFRRRLLCFGKFKTHASKEDITAVQVELQERDSVYDPSYDKVHDIVGNPLYASLDKDDEKQPMLDERHDLSLNGNTTDDLYSEPQTTSPTSLIRDEYAEPVDSLKRATENVDFEANPIYEGIYSEPLYGISGTILVGPQEDTLKRGYTMEKFPSDHLVFKEKIGDGQFGEVHIAEARIGDLNPIFGEEYKGRSKITVAVKTLKKNVSKDVRTDFFKEVRVMSRLQHENVVRLLGVCRDEPTVCMIVEYMENGDLNQFLRNHVLKGDDEEMLYANTKQPIKYEQLLYIATQIAAGMKYFASMNFVHRDLAARNCLVGDGLTVKLADFGMSRLLYSKHYYRVQGRVMLPIRWMAPESIFQGRFTTETDVWSFAITLWEVFTLAREFPYPDLSDEEVIGNAKTAFHKQPSSKIVYNNKPDVCEQDIYSILMRCWSSKPSSRPDFPSIHALLESKVGNVASITI